MKYKSSTLKSKWIKNSWLLKQPDLRRYVPKTMLFNRKNLATMLSMFSTVFFKPTGGTGGANIIRIKKKQVVTKFSTIRSKRITPPWMAYIRS